MPCASAKLQRAWKIHIERLLRKILPAVEGTSATMISKPRWMTRHPGFWTKAPGQMESTLRAHSHSWASEATDSRRNPAEVADLFPAKS